MKNPLSMRTRGRIYLLAIIISYLGLIIGPALVLVGAAPWASLVTVFVSATGALASTLARDNLASPEVPGDRLPPADPAIEGVAGYEGELE